MANVTVLEFDLCLEDGTPIWPPQNTTRGATPLTVTTSRGNETIVVCSDADCRMTTDGGAPLAYDVPILSVVRQTFRTGGGPVVFKFA